MAYLSLSILSMYVCVMQQYNMVVAYEQLTNKILFEVV